MTDWDPGAYQRFRGLRLRPAMDLLAQVSDLPTGAIYDLGCGTGVVGSALRQRWPERQICGVDSSRTMLAEAAGVYDRVKFADIAVWSETDAALIYSNAALHWVPDHAALFPRLLKCLAPGGVLAVQMPRQQMARSHVLLREVAAELFPDRFDWSDWAPQVSEPAAYLGWLPGASVWETEYYQMLGPVEDAHPVRAFTASTAARPILERLGNDEQARFFAAYDAALARAYPVDARGRVILPFRRVFAVARRAV